jgi:hydrogenase/urease accessory protein HupE
LLYRPRRQAAPWGSGRGPSQAPRGGEAALAISAIFALSPSPQRPRRGRSGRSHSRERELGAARAAASLGLALGVCLLLAATAAEGHQSSATFGDVARDEGAGAAGRITWRLRVRVADLAGALGAWSGPPGVSGQSGRRGRATAYLGHGLHLWAGDRSCAPGESSLAPDPSAPEPSLLYSQSFRCPTDRAAIRLRYDLFFEADRFHESFTRLALTGVTEGTSADAARSTVVFQDGLREIVVAPDEEPSVWRSAAIYLRLGIFHILTGYDHLSFLMALLLGAALSRRTTAHSAPEAASVRQALGGTVTVISAFTVAHSLTLIVQVLRPGWISTRWVEPAIALSVAYVGFENLVPRPPRHRWRLVFGFGLVHGLGFASVLREIGLPRRGLVLSLLSFNVGVELGQLLVLGLTFPLIVGAARRAPRQFERWGLQLGSGLIAAFGTVWLIARLAAR